MSGGNRYTTAYELLYRAGNHAHAEIENPDAACSQVISNLLLEIGLDRIVGKQPAFLNLTRNLVLSDCVALLPPDRVVIEVLEDVVVDQALLQALGAVRERGHQIALDDFVYHERLAPLVQMADIVKIDVLALDERTVAQQVQQLKAFGVKLVAEKVETQAMFRRCAELGFDYFQGYFLCRPEVLEGKRLQPSHLAALQLLARLQDPEVELQELTDLISRDLALSHQLLRLINSAAFALRREVQSIHQAVTLLGTRTVARMASLATMARSGESLGDLLVTASIRARMCELTGAARGGDGPEVFFVVGLFSVLDALFGRPMKDVLVQLPLADRVHAALLEREGILGEVLSAALAFEQGDWDSIARLPQAPAVLQQNYLEAIAWATEVTGRLGNGSPE